MNAARRFAELVELVAFWTLAALVVVAGIGYLHDRAGEGVVLTLAAGVAILTTERALRRTRRLRAELATARQRVAGLEAEQKAAVPDAMSMVFVGGPLDGAELPLPPCPCEQAHAPRGVLSDVGVYEPDGIARTTYRMKHTNGATP